MSVQLYLVLYYYIAITLWTVRGSILCLLISTGLYVDMLNIFASTCCNSLDSVLTFNIDLDNVLVMFFVPIIICFFYVLNSPLVFPSVFVCVILCLFFFFFF